MEAGQGDKEKGRQGDKKFPSPCLLVPLSPCPHSHSTRNMPKMTVAEIEAFYAALFQRDRFRFKIEEVAEGSVRIRLLYHELHLRPGGTISGPALMALADSAMYSLLLAMIGPVPLAVTTNLNINFLRKPAPVDVIAKAEMLKLGRRLAVGSVTMFSDGDDQPVAHATVTYSIPPQKE